MKVTCIGDPKIIMSNTDSKHNYFAWPTVARLQDGTIAVAASGFRRRHVCPFGKMCVSYSKDEGETYTFPAPVIDTPLDDRDGGIVPFGKSSVIVTSFNNTVNFQRMCSPDAYDLAYLDTVTQEDEDAYIGSTFRISHDCGVTFGPLYKSPVTSPHGPIELPDKTLLWIGRTFSRENEQLPTDGIKAYKVNMDGTMDYVGQVDNIPLGEDTYLSCEPHAIVLPDGRILLHIRVQAQDTAFTVYQSESSDNGRTWTVPEQILPVFGGSPPHLYRHSSGVLLSTYGFRGNPLGTKPFGVRVMLSKDEGRTWDIDHKLYENTESLDLGYPSTTELADGSLITVFYARVDEEHPAVIMQQRWRLEE